jgi:hypothetical protein
MTIILTDTGEMSVAARDGLWLAAADAEAATGWSLKPEGMCQDDICVPLPAQMARDGSVDLAAFWRHLRNPVVHDAARETFVLGTGADARNASLATLTAPDFELPDLDGTSHRLADLRGNKVFLTTWASW